MLGAGLIPCDPPLEQLWDAIHDLVPAEHPAWLLTRSADRYTNFLVLGVALLAIGGERKARWAKAYLAAAVGSALACEAIKWTVGRARPDFCGEINLFDPFTGAAGFHSFPSGHATNAAVMALFIALAFPRLRTPALVWAVLVGFARVTLDRHYFGDVIAGWGLAVLAYALAARRWGLLLPRPPIAARQERPMPPLSRGPQPTSLGQEASLRPPPAPSAGSPSLSPRPSSPQ